MPKTFVNILMIFVKKYLPVRNVSPLDISEKKVYTQ